VNLIEIVIRKELKVRDSNGNGIQGESQRIEVVVDARKVLELVLIDRFEYFVGDRSQNRLFFGKVLIEIVHISFGFLCKSMSGFEFGLVYLVLIEIQKNKF
jgi:hypothetical protein